MRTKPRPLSAPGGSSEDVRHRLEGPLDLKDGDRSLRVAKSGETLLEARGDTDVQIAR